MYKHDLDPELEHLLESLKDHPELGGDFDFQKTWIDIANRCGFDPDTSGMDYTWRDWLEFYIWDFTHQMLKPVGAMAFTVLLFVGGWIGIANASLGTLPGDRLYPVKLGMERIQMALTTSDTQRAQLRTEFTARRLEEMVALAASNKSTDVSQLATAVDRVKQDVADIKNELTSEPSGQAAELAKAVGRKADVYSSTVKSSSTGLPSDVQKQVQEVQTIIDETKDQAVDVMITAHEQAQTEENTHELELAFQKAFAHASSLATKDEQKKLETAAALQKQNAYRRAFQLLKEIELVHTTQE